MCWRSNSNTSHRSDRLLPQRSQPTVLLIHSLYAIATTLIAVGLLFGFRRGFHRLNDIVEQRLKTHLKALEAQSARFLKAQQLANALGSALKIVFVLLKAALVSSTSTSSSVCILGRDYLRRGCSNLILGPNADDGLGHSRRSAGSGLHRDF